MFAEHRATLFGMAGKELSGGRRGDRRGFGERPPGAPGEPGLHGVRRFGRRSAFDQGRRDHGAVAEDRLAVRLHQRFGRRARAGGHRLALRLRQGVLHERDALRRGAADLLDLRTVRGRRGVQSGADRFHHSDAAGADVHHRPAGDQGRHRRERDGGAVGRPRGAHGQLRRDPLHRRGRPACRAAGAEAAELPAFEQPGRSAAGGRRPQRGSRSDAGRHCAGRQQEGLRRSRRDRARWWTSATFWKCSPATR